jgi:hypothetical protein
MWWYREGNKEQGWRRVGALSPSIVHILVWSLVFWMSNLSSNYIVFNINNSKNSLFHTLSETLTLKTSKTWRTLFHTFELKTWNLKTWRHSSRLKNLQHFEEVSSTPPTHLEKLQAPCMPPLGNELPLTLQTKNLVSKGFSPFFYVIQVQTFHYFLF